MKITFGRKDVLVAILLTAERIRLCSVPYIFNEISIY